MSTIRRFCREDHGGEIIEYALIAGLIVIGAISLVAALGGKVLARWQSVSSASF